VAAARVPLAITMGDPAGIGPEVALKALTARDVAARVTPILVGDPAVWRDTATRLGLSLHFSALGTSAPRGHVAVAATSKLAARRRMAGAPDSAKAQAVCGDAAYRAIVEAVRLTHVGQAAGVVTAPISKAHLNAAGHDFPGHTELLASLCGGVSVRMMMVGARLRVVLATTHIAIADVPRRLSRDGILESIGVTADGLRRHFGIAAPRVAVAGLNPHAGEDGLFGDEEGRIIRPAVEAARARGIDARGPLAADGLFALAARGDYDAIVCMYHDQGLAPFKLLHFADGVNLTLGLPFVRTSPDHGTAFDIAGTGQADARSMVAAIRLAVELIGRSSLRPRAEPTRRLPGARTAAAVASENDVPAIDQICRSFVVEEG
jgi:4-phospho-D-threonate 3-dehydrogenase / 4-phospho-D-erythronate 3-dehydrogenase